MEPKMCTETAQLIRNDDIVFTFLCDKTFGHEGKHHSRIQNNDGTWMTYDWPHDYIMIKGHTE